MKYLNKITISNARRFAKDVEIDFSNGATILLAPNGTGKTTVFEAIEFALTGAVQRLGNNTETLIRDKEQELDIRLDFDGDLFCSVNYRKGSKPTLSGNHDLIFKDRDITEIPYLLRLTHLLEQRGGNWFVQQSKSSDAGNLLDKLSIGKELNKVFATKTSATKAANIARNNIEQKLNKKKEKLQSFDILIEQRKAVANDFTLRALNEIINDIIIIHLKHNNTPLVIEENIGAVNSATAVVSSQLNSKLDDNTLIAVRLAKFDEYIKDYLATNRILSSSKIELEKQIGDNAKQKLDLDQLKNQIKEANDKINELKLKLTSLIELRNNAANIATVKETLLSLDKEIVTLNNSLANRKGLLIEIVTKLENSHAINDKHKSVSDKYSNLSKVKGVLVTKFTLKDEWISHNIKINKIDTEILPVLNNRLEAINKEIAAKFLEIKKHEDELNNNKAIVTSLKGIHDNINEAVGIIASNLPDDKGDCPVCSAEYTPIELKERISKAMSYVDPLLADSIKNVKNSNDLIITVKSQHDIFLKDKSELDTQISASNAERTLSVNYINNNILPLFNGNKNTDEANRSLLEESSNLEKYEKTLSEEKSNLPSIVSIDELEVITNDKNKFEREISEFQASLEGFKSKQISSNESLFNLQQKVGENKLEDLRAETLTLETSIPTKIIDFEKLKQQLADLTAQTEDLDKNIISDKNILQSLEIKKNELLAAWHAEGFINEPNQIVFEEKIKKLSEEKKSISLSISKFVEIDKELAKWKVAEEYNKINTEVKNIIGTYGEEEFKKRISNEVNDAVKEIEDFDKKKSALDSLYIAVNSELEVTNTHIESINPMWNSLLKRVVVNPRFAETLLSSYKKSNKPQANVSVKIHGISTSVSNVASEAQLTDLQLTFLLSMANKYQWTPWKALLLDDPTQHHDLVHSASVFDLLRDYIIQKQYQVLIGTHDSVHANFFKRKLDNDGIPVKLWSLKSDDIGVKAELME